MPLAYQGNAGQQSDDAQVSFIPRPKVVTKMSPRHQRNGGAKTPKNGVEENGDALEKVHRKALKEHTQVVTKERLLKHQQLKLEQANYYHGCGFSKDMGDIKPLPSGWKCVKDSYGRMFFRHDASSHSCWVEPKIVQVPWKYRTVLDSFGHLLSSTSDTQWVRLTLEADEDRVKLFSALYHLVLDEVINETHKFFVKEGKGIDPAIPTLAECRKKCKRMQVPEEKYCTFLEKVLRKKMMRGGTEKEKSVNTPRSSNTNPRSPSSKSFVATTPKNLQSRSPSSRSLYASPDSQRRRAQNAAISPRRTSRSASPPRRRMNLGEADLELDSLSLAEFGSLQAKVFREKRVKQLQNAKLVKNQTESQSSFGRLTKDIPMEETMDVPKMPKFELVRRRSSSLDIDTGVTLVQEIDIPTTPESETTNSISSRDRTELERTLAQIEIMREELLKVQEKVHVKRRKRPEEGKEGKDLSQQSSQAIESQELNTTVDEYLALLEPDERSIISDGGEENIVIANETDLGYCSGVNFGHQCNLQEEDQWVSELHSALRLSQERENHLKRQLDSTQSSEKAMQREVDASRREIHALRKAIEDTKNRYTTLLSQSEQRELEMQGQIDSFRIQLKHSEALAEAKSDQSTKSTAEVAATTVANKNLERLSEAQEALRRANEARQRAERRASESSERVVKLTESLSKALAENESEKADSLQLKNDIVILRQSMGETTRSRDQLMEELRETREKQFVTLESERVERAALNREIAELRSEIMGLKRKEVRRRASVNGPISSKLKFKLDVDNLSHPFTDIKERLIDHAQDMHKEETNQEEAEYSETKSVGSLKEMNNEDDTQESQSEVDDGESTTSSGAFNLKFEQQANKIQQLEKELFDAKCSLSRLTQRLKQSENDAASYRYDVKSARQGWKTSESKFESQIQNLETKLREKSESMEQALASESKAKESLYNAREEIETLSFRIKDLENRIVTANTAKVEAENQALALKRDHAQILAVKQQEMEEYRAGLDRHYSKCKSVWESEHSETVSELKTVHAGELESCLTRVKLESRMAVEEQRNLFMSQIAQMEEDHAAVTLAVRNECKAHLMKVQQAHQLELRKAIDSAMKSERGRAEASISESLVQREVELVKLRRGSAIVSLDRMARTKRVSKIALAWIRWQKWIWQNRADELVEVYGGAMDQTNAAAKLVVLFSRINMRACQIAFKRLLQFKSNHSFLHSPPPPPPFSPNGETIRRLGKEHFGYTKEELFYHYAMYPGELARKIRRKIPSQAFAIEIQNFVKSLEVNLDGKISPHVFHDALLQTSERCALRAKRSPFNQENTFSVNLKESTFRRQFGENARKETREFEVTLCEVYLGADHIFHARQRRAQQNLLAPTLQLVPSKDWSIKAAVVLTKVSYLSDRRSLLAKARAWARLVANLLSEDRLFDGDETADQHSTKPHPRYLEAEFIRNMETQALQEEVRALHAQLGASKAEAWKYKRKLLSQYLKNS